MAEARLDIVSDFGDLFPNLAKVGTATDEIKAKNETLKESFKSSFAEGSKSAQDFTSNANTATQSVADQVAKIESLKQKISELRIALDTNKNDSGIVSILTKELKAAETELVKAGGKVEDFSKKNVNENKKAGDSYKGLKTQILEAVKELSRATDVYGKYSKEAIDAAKKVSALKDEQQRLNAMISALDPDAKFNALGQLASGAAGGVQAVVSGMVLLGAESEPVERLMLKLNAALSFTRGIDELLNIGDAFGSLKSVLGITSAATKIAAEEGANLTDTLVEAGTATSAVVGGIEKSATAVNALGDTIVRSTAATQGLTLGQKLYAVGTNIATTATVIFNAALKALTGPIGIVLGGIALIYGAFKLFSTEAEKFSVSLDRMKKASDDFAKSSEDLAQKNKNNLKDLENNLNVFKSSEEARIALLKKNGASEKELADEKKKLSDDVLKHEIEIGKKIADQAAADIEKNALRIRSIAIEVAGTVKKIKSGDLSSDELTGATEQNAAAIKEQRALIQINEDKQQIIEDANAKIKVIKSNAAKENFDIDSNFNKSQKELDKKAYDDRIKAEKEFQDVFSQLKLKAIAARSVIDNDEGKLEAERKIALLEIENLEKILVEKGKVRDKNFKLTEEQEKQFSIIRYAIETNFLNKIVDLENQKRLIVAEATKTGLEKELEVFRIGFEAREKLMIQKGVSRTVIEKIKGDEELKIKNDYALKQLDIEAETSKAIVDQIKINGVSEANADRIRNQKRLEVDLEYANKKLELLQSQKTTVPNPELDKEIELSKAAIAKFGREIEASKKDIIANSEPFSLGKLFGFTGEEAEKFNQAASDFLSSIQEIGNELLAASLANVDAQLEANQTLIDDYDNRINEIGNLIKKEEDRQKKGVANNLELRKQEEAQLKIQREKALAEEKRLQDEKRKLQKEQAQINAAAAASQMIISTVNVIQSLSGLPFGIGVVLGLAAAAALVAGYLNIKNSIKASESLGEGGMVGGKYHTEDGGNKYISQDGNKVLYTEKGEYYVNKKQTKKHFNIIDAVNFNRLDSIDLNEIFPFLKKEGILLSSDIAKGVSEKKAQVAYQESNFYAFNNSGLKEEISEMKTLLHSEVKNINDRMDSEPKYHTNQNGNLVKVVNRGSITEEIEYTNGG